MKLAIGTASFGMSYGISNSDGKVNTTTANEILELAKFNNISVLDTAIAYGDSEENLGKIGVGSFNVISKLPSIPSNTKNIKKWIISETKESIERMGIKNLYALLLHSPQQLLGPFGKEIYDSLVELKTSEIVQKIGISVYSPDELNSLLSIGDFDLVQCPMNIIDQRLANSGWLKTLKSKNIEVHTRSCFLQGLLLLTNDKIPKKFNNWDSLWLEWNRWLTNNGYSAFHVCLSYCLSFNEIDHVIVGVENTFQLQEILSVYDKALIKEFPNIASEDINLVNPVNWKNL